MDAIYRYQDYREAVRFVVKAKQQLDTTLTQQRLAEAMGIQKSYLSQVLGGRAELSSDQAYLFCRYFDFNSEQSTYFAQLVEFSRTGIADRRTELQTNIAAAQAKKRTSEAHLKVNPSHDSEDDLRDYYLDAYHQLVHVCLSNAKFRKDPLSLAAALGLHPQRFEEILNELQRLSIISLEKAGLKVLRRNLHLPKEAKVFKAWRSQVRAMALQKSLQSASGEAYNFTVLFSANEKVRVQLHEKFLEYIKSAQELVNGADPAHVYQINFDLMKWL